MKVLVWGSSGAIGSNLVPWLSKNHKVISMKSDIRDLKLVEKEVLENLDAKWIINLAGIVSSVLCDLAKKHAYHVNVRGAENIALIAKKYDIGLCHFSTTAIYKPTDVIQENSKIEPQTWYGTTKRLGELIVKKTLREKALIIRPCFAFGGDNDKSIASKLIYSAYYNEPIIVQLGLNYRKDYMHILNLCDATEKILLLDYKGEVNVSIGKPIKFKKVIETAKKVVGRDPFIYLVSEDDYMKDHVVDNTRLLSLIDWKPTISLEEGMKIVLKKYASQLD